jgi:membrane-bound lytic murein transglycosylase MltF
MPAAGKELGVGDISEAEANIHAGVGRISQLRKEAAKRGLDPNVWFHNVRRT